MTDFVPNRPSRGRSMWSSPTPGSAEPTVRWCSAGSPSDVELVERAARRWTARSRSRTGLWRRVVRNDPRDGRPGAFAGAACPAPGRRRATPRHPLDIDEMRTELLQFCQALGRGVAKLIVTRGTGQRGYALPLPCRPQRLLLGSPLPAYPAQHAECGIRLFPCDTRLAEQPRLAGVKHLNRLEQVLARAEWQDPAFAEGLMRDMSGRVIEGVFSNLFLITEATCERPRFLAAVSPA